jgi:hypothetical protein
MPFEQILACVKINVVMQYHIPIIAMSL